MMTVPHILALIAGCLAVIGMIWQTYPLLNVAVLLLAVAFFVR